MATAAKIQTNLSTVEDQSENDRQDEYHLKYFELAGDALERGQQYFIRAKSSKRGTQVGRRKASPTKMHPLYKQTKPVVKRTKRPTEQIRPDVKPQQHSKPCKN